MEALRQSIEENFWQDKQQKYLATEHITTMSVLAGGNNRLFGKACFLAERDGSKKPPAYYLEKARQELYEPQIQSRRILL